MTAVVMDAREFCVSYKSDRGTSIQTVLLAVAAVTVEALLWTPATRPDSEANDALFAISIVNG